jgi:hypothetical protein
MVFWETELISLFLMEVLASTAISTVLIGALAWLTRSWISEKLKNSIKHEYDEKLETHKAQMKAQSDVELEKLRSSLAVASAERNVRFTKLHERRAKVISKTYALLRDLHTKLGNYVKPFSPAWDRSRDEKRKEVAEAHDAFFSYYSQNKIFLSKEAVTKIDDINQQSGKIIYDFFYGIEMKTADQGDSLKVWLEICNRVKDEMPVALGELEEEFRKLLGDES